MNARLQITSEEPTIRSPAWRSASPKKRKTRSPNTSRTTRVAKIAMSPRAAKGLFGDSMGDILSHIMSQRRFWTLLMGNLVLWVVTPAAWVLAVGLIGPRLNHAL